MEAKPLLERIKPTWTTTERASHAHTHTPTHEPSRAEPLILRPDQPFHPTSASFRMYLISSAGYASAIGTAIPPAVHTAHVAATYAAPGGAMIATREPAGGDTREA